MSTDLTQSANFRACKYLLRQLGWFGEDDQILKLLPSEIADIDLSVISDIVNHFGWSVNSTTTSFKDLNDHLPAICIHRDGKISIVYKKESNGQYLMYNPEDDQYVAFSGYRSSAVIMTFSHREEIDHSALRDNPISWFMNILLSNRSILGKVVSLGVFGSFLMAIPPLLVVMIFSQIYSRGDTETLTSIWIASGLYVAYILFTKILNSYLVVSLDHRMGGIIHKDAFKHMILLPKGVTKRWNVSEHYGHFRRLEDLRRYFVKSLAKAIIEVPFNVIILLALYWIQPTMALIPFISILLFSSLAMVTSALLKDSVVASRKSSSKINDVLGSTLYRHQSIRYSGSSGYWRGYFSSLIGKDLMARLNEQNVVAVASGLGSLLFGITNVITMYKGVQFVAEEVFSPGMYLTVQLLTLIITSPLQGLVTTKLRYTKLKWAFIESHDLMNAKVEKGFMDEVHMDQRVDSSKITFKNVSFQHMRDSFPALREVNFAIEKSKITVLYGHGGCGKSSVVNLLLGLDRPTSGKIYYDKTDSTKIRPQSLRHQIAYLPQKEFYLQRSLNENLHIVDPHNDQEKRNEAFKLSGLQKEIEEFGVFMDLFNDPNVFESLPRYFIIKFNFALMFLKGSNLWVLDDPFDSLDDDGKKVMVDTLKSLASLGKTIVIATKDRQLFSIADKIVFLDSGRVDKVLVRKNSQTPKTKNSNAA